MADLTSSYYPSSQQPHYPNYYSHPPPPPPGVGPPPSQPPPQPYPYHPDYYHQPPPPPHDGAASEDEVRTLFIAGLPDDVKPREIYNLFRSFPGYESCQVRWTGQSSQAFAFSVFTDQPSAIAAMHALNGMVFDLEKDKALHIDLAKSNSRSKRRRADDGHFGSDKKGRGPVASSQGFPDSGFGSHIPAMVNSAHSTNGYTSSQSHLSFEYGRIVGYDAQKSASAAFAPQSNTPCRTLFVSNLVPRCSEQELMQVFSRCPGFSMLKLKRNKDKPVAFVDFRDDACSTAALNQLQGVSLHGERLRLEYAKARMGLGKREGP